MSKVVKLNNAQLKALINEAVASKSKKINEGNALAPMVDSLEMAIEDSVTSALEALYDERDPSMRSAGQDAWNQQSHAAAMDIVESVSPSLSRIILALLNGEYYRG